MIRKLPAFIVLLICAIPLSMGTQPRREPGGVEDAAAMIRQDIEALCALGPRPAASPGEARAAEHIAARFRSLGLAADIEPFEVESFEIDSVEAKIGSVTFRPVGLGLDPYAGEIGYSGPFVVLDPQDAAGWPSRDHVAGKAVVTSEGGDPSLHFRIAAQGPRMIVDLSADDLERVRASTEGEISVTIRGGLVKAESRNVVARIGTDAPSPQIVIGAHLDAYRDSPGANDNASGIAALLETARSLMTDGIPAGIGLTFVAFGAEEVGVAGSRAFVDRHAAELKDCALAFAFDDLGGIGPVQVERNGGRGEAGPVTAGATFPEPYRGRAWEGLRSSWRLLPPPSLFAAVGEGVHPPWLVESIDAAARESGFEMAFGGLGGSDQMAFAAAGIPTSGVFAPNGRGHTPGDRPDTVEVATVARGVDVAGRIIRKVVTRFTPPRSPSPSAPDSVRAPAEAESHAMADVRFLASDKLRGRRAGTPDADAAAKYIAERLRAAGVAALPGAPDYFQEVTRPAGSGATASQNVIGVIRGSDPRKADEYVLLAAHYDGLGTSAVDGVMRTFNGARDDAMGVAALLAAAESLAAHPSARSVLLLATTFEEEGLLGSGYFVRHPPVRLDRIAFVLNNDGAGAYEPGLWRIGGLERTTAAPLAEAAGRAHGLATLPYPEKLRHLFAEGDAMRFDERGIPSLTVSPGFLEGQVERISRVVHTPADRVDGEFDAGYLARFCAAYAGLARAIADAASVPTRVKTGS